MRRLTDCNMRAQLLFAQFSAISLGFFTLITVIPLRLRSIRRFSDNRLLDEIVLDQHLARGFLLQLIALLLNHLHVSILLRVLAYLLMLLYLLSWEFFATEGALKRLITIPLMSVNISCLELSGAELAMGQASAEVQMLWIVITGEAFSAGWTLGWLVADGFMIIKLVKRVLNSTKSAIGWQWALGLMLVDNLLREIDATSSALSWLFAVDFMFIEVSCRVLVPTDSTPDKLVAVSLMVFDIGFWELEIAESASNRLITVSFMFFKVFEGDLKLTESASSGSTLATVRGSVTALYEFKADWTVIVWQLRTIILVVDWRLV